MGILDAPALSPSAAALKYLPQTGPYPIRGRDLPGSVGIPTVNTGLGTATLNLGSTTSITSGVKIPPTRNNFRAVHVEPIVGTGFPDNQGWQSAGAYTQGTSSAPWAVEFELDSVLGTFEVHTKGVAGKMRVLVNGQLLQAAPITLPSDGSQYLLTVALTAGAGQYRVRIEIDGNGHFWGIFVGPTDGVTASARRGPRVACLGDSFWEPTIADTVNAYCGTQGLPGMLSYCTGWDVFPAGLGSTGLVNAPTTLAVSATAGTYTITFGGQTTTGIAFNASLATIQSALQALSSIGTGNVLVNGTTTAPAITLLNGLAGTKFTCTINTGGLTGTVTITTSKVKFADRLPEILAIPNLDGLFVAMSSNDGNHSAAAVLAQAQAVVTLAKAAGLTRYGQIIVLSPWWTRGSQGVPSSAFAQNDAVQAWCATQNIPFIDSLTPPVANAVSTTMTSATIVGASSLLIAATIPIGSWIKVGVAGAAEVRQTVGLAGTGPFTVSFSGAFPFVNAHAIGDPVQQVDASDLTGAGSMAATTGSGTADRYTGTDGTHPSVAGAMYRAKRITARMLHAIPH